MYDYLHIIYKYTYVVGEGLNIFTDEGLKS